MFYYTRFLKTGERLVTAYNNKALAARIAGQESSSSDKSLWEGDIYVNTKTGAIGPNQSGMLVLSHLKGTSTEQNNGSLAIFARTADGLNDLGIRFEAYADANKFIKAIAGSYPELLVVKLEVEEPESDEFSSEAPF